MVWKRFAYVAVVGVLLSAPTVAQQNQTGGSAATVTDAAYDDAVATAATPSSYGQAATLFKAVGAEIAFILGGVLTFLLLTAGVAGYWREDRFWAVYFLTFLAAIASLILLPSLWLFL